MNLTEGDTEQVPGAPATELQYKMAKEDLRNNLLGGECWEVQPRAESPRDSGCAGPGSALDCRV